MTIFCCNPAVDLPATGKHIRTLMAAHHYTVKSLAAALCRSEGAVKNYLRGRDLPPLECLQAMRQLFELDKIEDIIVWERLQ